MALPDKMFPRIYTCPESGKVDLHLVVKETSKFEYLRINDHFVVKNTRNKFSCKSVKKAITKVIIQIVDVIHDVIHKIFHDE